MLLLLLLLVLTVFGCFVAVALTQRLLTKDTCILAETGAQALQQTVVTLVLSSHVLCFSCPS